MEKLNEWGNIYGLGGQSILEICLVSNIDEFENLKTYI